MRSRFSLPISVRNVTLVLPTNSLYHSQISGEIGSPTEPKVLKELKSYLAISCSPALRNNLKAVGAT